jgi:hypothetical protein
MTEAFLPLPEPPEDQPPLPPDLLAMRQQISQMGARNREFAKLYAQYYTDLVLAGCNLQLAMSLTVNYQNFHLQASLLNRGQNE